MVARGNKTLLAKGYGYADEERRIPAAPEKYSRADLINFFKNEPLQFAPGERWAYSNANYTLLGVIIERASGRTYDQYPQENFFRPLALRTIHSCRTRPVGERFATGYVPKGEGVVVAPRST